MSILFADSGRFPLITKKEKTLRVILSNGSTTQLTGEVLYFLRPRSEFKLTAKNIADEAFFGFLPVMGDAEESTGFLLESLSKRLQDVYLEHLKASKSWVVVPDPSLGLKIKQQFIVSVEHYCEFLQGTTSIPLSLSISSPLVLSCRSSVIFSANFAYLYQIR